MARGSEKKSYDCKKCGKGFARESALVNHTNLSHPGEKQKQNKTTAIAKDGKDSSKKKQISKCPKTTKYMNKRLALRKVSKKSVVISNQKDIKKSVALNAALQFGFKSVDEMFARKMKLKIEKIQVPEKLWGIIEKIESDYKQSPEKGANSDDKLRKHKIDHKHNEGAKIPRIDSSSELVKKSQKSAGASKETNKTSKPKPTPEKSKVEVKSVTLRSRPKRHLAEESKTAMKDTNFQNNVKNKKAEVAKKSVEKAPVEPKKSARPQRVSSKSDKKEVTEKKTSEMESSKGEKESDVDNNKEEKKSSTKEKVQVEKSQKKNVKTNKEVQTGKNHEAKVKVTEEKVEKEMDPKIKVTANDKNQTETEKGPETAMTAEESAEPVIEKEKVLPTRQRKVPAKFRDLETLTEGKSDENVKNTNNKKCLLAQKAKAHKQKKIKGALNLNRLLKCTKFRKFSSKPLEKKIEKPANKDRKDVKDQEKPANKDRKHVKDQEKPANKDRKEVKGQEKPANKDRKEVDCQKKPANKDRKKTGSREKPANMDRKEVDNQEKPVGKAKDDKKIVENVQADKEEPQKLPNTANQIQSLEANIDDQVEIVNDETPVVDKSASKDTSLVRYISLDAVSPAHGAFSTDGKGYWCEVCNRGFSRLAALMKHKLWSHTKKQVAAVEKSSKTTTKKEEPKKSSQTIKAKSSKAVTSKSNKAVISKLKKAVNSKSNKAVNSSKEFKCSECSKSFGRIQSLRSHKSSHSNKRNTYQCKVCAELFTNKQEHRAHERAHSETDIDETLFPCPDCDMKFREPILLEKHLAFSHKHRPFECASCGKQFGLLVNLRRHERVVHRGGGMAANQSKKKLDPRKRHSDSLHSKRNQTSVSKTCSKTHQNFVDVTEDNTSAHCDMCNQSFNSRKEKRRHMVKVHGPEWVHTCAVCFKVFPDRGMLLRHQIIHKETENTCSTLNGDAGDVDNMVLPVAPYVDDVLIQSFDGHSSDIGQSTLSPIPKADQSSPTPPKALKFSSNKNECQFCRKVFDTDYQLFVHKTTVHIDAKNLPSSEAPTNFKSVRCYSCSQRFSDVVALNQHIQSAHRSEVSYYECKTCGKKFQSFSLYNQHVMNHSECKGLVCQFCSRKFSKESELNAHLKNQHPDVDQDEFQCKFCDQIFEYYSEFYKHVESHPKDDPFSCIHCKTSFTNKSSLKLHLPVHGVLSDSYKMPCPKCYKVFTNLNKLKEHEKSFCPLLYARKERKQTLPASQNEQQPPKPVHVEKYIRCEFCFKKFVSNSMFKLHKQMHYKDKRFACEFCNIGFAGNSDLARHRLDHYYDSEFKCFVCNKMFLDTEDLRKHEADHKANGPMFCTVRVLGQSEIDVKPGIIDVVDLDPIVEDLVSRKWKELP